MLNKDYKILDSGDRTEFETGAVRDLKFGKGRFDLMPLQELSNLMGGDVFIGLISDFVRTKNPDILYEAIKQLIFIKYEEECHERSYNEEKIGDVFKEVTAVEMLHLAVHFEKGAEKYGERNWEKGIPVNCYIDSALRHYTKWIAKFEDEDHYISCIWNLICCIWTVNNCE